MATISEAKDSRKCTDGDDPSAELRFNIAGTEDDSEARLLLLATAPLTWTVGGKTLVQKQRSLDPAGGGHWKGSVTYGRRKTEKETGESSYQFEIGGGSSHITQAIAQSKYPATAPDAKGAIGVTADGQVQGVDIQAPTYAWSETHYLPVAAVTPAYKATLYAIAAAPVNNATWRGFAAGEVLFKGASGQQRGEEDWAVTFKFEASPNATGLTVGDITGISKKGWEYLTVLYEDAELGTPKKIVPKPVAVYVNQVYGSSNFAGLGIGS